MRLTSLVLAAMLAGATPASAAWQEFVYEDLGIAKYFPAQPKVEQSTYGEGIRLPLSKIVPSTIVSVEHEGVIYKMTVVDFRGREAEGANLLAEAIYTAGNKGTVIDEGFPRLDLGSNSVYGLVMIVDEKGGDRATSGFFFNKGRMYVIQGIVPKDSPNKASAGVGRFIETVRFHLAGYGFDETLGKDFPLGDDDPGNRDTRPRDPRR